jgi:hypothetical protein
MGMTKHKIERNEKRGSAASPSGAGLAARKRKATTKGSRILGFTLIFNLSSFTCFSEVLA